MQRDRLARIAKLVWAAPCSLVGLVLAGFILLLGGSAVRAFGVLQVALREGEATGRAERLLPFRAIAFGHVIIALSASELQRLRAHELVHVQQYERWGIAFFPAYVASSLWQLLRGRGVYWNNHFEVQARLLSGEEQQGRGGA